MVKRGHEVDLEYSKKKILKKLNSFLGYNAVEKLKLTLFEDQEGSSKKILTPISFNISLTFISSISHLLNKY